MDSVASGDKDASATGDSGNGDHEHLWRHHDIGVLIRRTKNYVVHLDKKNSKIDWGTTDEFDRLLETLEGYNRAKHNGIFGEVAVLEARPCLGLDQAVIQDFRVLLGEALVCALERDYETSNKLLVAASAYFEARSHEKSRLWYLKACLWTAGPCVAVGLAVVIQRPLFEGVLGPTVVWLTLASIAGAVGALFSVLLRVGGLNVDCAAGKTLHDLEGFSRILAGGIAGALVAIAFKSGALFPVVLQSNTSPYLTLLLCMMAGVGERFAVSLITKFEAEKLSNT